MDFDSLPQRQPSDRKRRRNADPSAAATPAPSSNNDDESIKKEKKDEEKVNESSESKSSSTNNPSNHSLLRPVNYEYLDHTADVQIHSWGIDLREAFENAGIAMCGYMTEIGDIVIDEHQTRTIQAKGHDLSSLLFSFMDEVLFAFAGEEFISKDIRISLFDRDEYSIEAVLYGELFSLSKHKQGTEVKAITYSNMQIHEKKDEGRADVYIIIDI